MDIGAVVLAIAEGIGANILYDGKENIGKKRKFESELEDIISSSVEFYENKIKNEVFYDDLQKVFLRDKWVERIIYYYFGMGEEHSCEYMAKDLVTKFVDEFPKWSVYEKPIKDSLLFLKKELFNKFEQAKYIPDVNKVFGLIQNNTNLIIENSNRNTEYIIQSIKTSNTIKDGKYIETISNSEEGNSYSCIDEDDEQQVRFRFSNEHNQLACQYIQQQEYEKAIDVTRELLDKYPNDVYGLFNLSTALYWKMIAGNTYAKYNGRCLPHNNYDYSEIIENAEKAFNIVGADDTDILNFYGFILLISGKDTDLAEKLFLIGVGRALENNEEDSLVDSWTNLALLYLIHRDFDQCKVALYHCDVNKFTKAIAGNMYAMIGVEEKDKAIAIFKELYQETAESEFLKNVKYLEEGKFFDSIFVNGMFIEIYSDEELKCRRFH